MTRQPNQWSNLSCQRGQVSKAASRCSICGGAHSTKNHLEVIAESGTQPNPADLIDELAQPSTDSLK